MGKLQQDKQQEKIDKLSSENRKLKQQIRDLQKSKTGFKDQCKTLKKALAAEKKT